MGGLSLEGQLNSYPNLLAGQFKAVGGGDFVQPLSMPTKQTVPVFSNSRALTPPAIP
jgi:hypothetical protein